MSWTIPLTDVEVTEADVDAVIECLDSGWLTMGPRTEAFEAAFAELCGVEHAVAVSSGTAALHLALLAAGIGPGDEVLVPALTFVAGAAAVRYCGATPVFVDSLGPHDLNLDPATAARLVTPRTRAVLATHWMGYACDLSTISELCDASGLLLLEDCAQSVTARDRLGRMTGTVGAAGCFSFFSKKQLAVGEGGMVISSDAGLAAKVRSLRSHAMTSVTWDRHRGHADGYDVVDIGFNYRIDEPRAALGLSRLPRLLDDVERRRGLVRRYRELLSGAPGLVIPWSDEEVERSAHFGFPVLLESGARRTAVERALDARGIQTTCYPALPTLTAYLDGARCPVARELASRHLLLPLAACFAVGKVESVAQQLLEITGDAGAIHAA
jgi:dTDP-4-amino-4,6-dideoxygalactose transaminase